MVERLRDKPDCEMCRATWALSDREPPNCDICMPDIMPQNITTIEVYFEVRDQHIMGSGGPVGLNLVALDLVLRKMEVENYNETFERVHRLYQKVISKEALLASAERNAH